MSKITIKEVAKGANVSISTVSRVLNNNYPVRDEIRKKVLDAMKELDYQPNGLARSLKGKKTNTIGVIVADISNVFFMQIAKGIENVVYNYGYNLIISSTDDDPSKEYQILNSHIEKRVDGIIMSPCNNNPDFVERLIDNGLPVVLVDRKIPGLKVDTIVEDNFSSAYNLVNHLITCGHKRISIVNGLCSVSSGKERFDGYRKALENNRIALKDEYILNGDFRRENAYFKVKEMLECIEKDQLPTAIFAANNLMAEGTMMALDEKNIKIPEDISLVSFGDLSIPELIKPRITSISQNAISIGQKAGELIINKIYNDDDSCDRSNKEIIMVSDLYMGRSVKNL